MRTRKGRKAIRDLTTVLMTFPQPELAQVSPPPTTPREGRGGLTVRRRGAGGPYRQDIREQEVLCRRRRRRQREHRRRRRRPQGPRFGRGGARGVRGQGDDKGGGR